jgi:putative transposase
MPELARSTLSDANRNRPHELFRAVAAQLIQASLLAAKKLPRRLKRIRYCLDSTSMELCAELFRWALVSPECAAIKLHTLIRTDVAIPELTFISEGRRHDLVVAKKMPIPPGSIVSMDRAYVDAQFFADLHDQDTVFVTRIKRGMKYRVLHRRRVPRGARGVQADQEILLTGKGASIYGDRPLRRISYRDPKTRQLLVFLTNSQDLAARTIAGLYKERWQVELFFKWIKQNLKIKSFWGRSRNAVLIQIWVALLAYALASWINLRLRTTWTRLRTWRFVQTRLLHPVSNSFWISDA